MGVSVGGRPWQVLRCKVCGKEFYVSCIGEWVYKDHRGRPLCTYKCMRTLERQDHGRINWAEVAATEKRDKPYRPPEHWYEIARLKAEGKSYEEIGQMMGRTANAVRDALSRLHFYERYGIPPSRR